MALRTVNSVLVMKRLATSAATVSLENLEKLATSVVVTTTWRRVCFAAVLLLVALGVNLSRLVFGENAVESSTVCFIHGSCTGLACAVAHVPNSRAKASRRLWERLVAALVILLVTAYVSTYPWHLVPRLGDLPEGGIEKRWIILTSCLCIAPVAMACMLVRHPRSRYVYDAKWCVVGLWLVTIMYAVYFVVKAYALHDLMNFLLAASLTTEGVILSWIVCLFCTRIRSLGLLERAASDAWIYAMSIAFQLNILMIIVNKILDGVNAVLYISIFLRAAFLVIWLSYTCFLARCLLSSLGVLRVEVRRVRGPARAEAQWAGRVLLLELAACLAIGLTTFAFWGLVEIIRIYQVADPATSDSFKHMLSPVVSWIHRVDLIINALSLAVFSGMLWQAAPPGDYIGEYRKVTRMRTQASMQDGLDAKNKTIYARKVEELAGRGVLLRDLLEFWISLLEHGAMPSFDPWQSTTNDVVRQAIIPQSRSRVAWGGGDALATLWSNACPVFPERMVTHNWSNLFLHLVAAVIAEALALDTYMALAELLALPLGPAKVRAELERRKKLDMSFWICSFSVNQHASICNDFGPAPGEGTQERADWERKTRDTVTGERYPVCDCSEEKLLNDRPAACELNKFDSVMRILHRRNPSFAHSIVVDCSFQVFFRAWCVAEIVEGRLLGIASRVMIHSETALDVHYETLCVLDVRNCQASREEDKEMILARICSIDAFNLRLQELIFGTQGLFSKWVDGQERAGQIGRIVRRARTKMPAELVLQKSTSTLAECSEALAALEDDCDPPMATSFV